MKHEYTVPEVEAFEHIEATIMDGEDTLVSGVGGEIDLAGVVDEG